MTNDLGGTFTFRGTDITVKRLGYGAMQTVGKMAYGEPRDRDEVLAVLREAAAAGVDHIDTSDYYGPHIANRLIKEALSPYPENLTIVTKLGARREADKSWPTALSAAELESGLRDNLANLGLDAMDIVNLRVGDMMSPNDKPLAEPLTALVKLKEQGLVRHIGISNVSAAQVAEAESITEIVCVQNNYNLAHRADDALIDELAAKGIAYVPYFPLGGFKPLQSEKLNEIAARLDATPMQTALAWLLRRAPNILLIPGTSSLAHLRENIAAAELELPDDVVAELDTIAGK